MQTIKKRLSAGVLALVMLLLTACQRSPESSIVKHKDLDNMIAEAENTESGISDVEQIAENYDTYQTVIQNDSLHVNVNVDAKVDIPDAEYLSVVRVRQKEVSQEYLDRVRSELLPDITLYDGRALKVQPKAELESLIQIWKQNLADIKADSALSEEDRQMIAEEYQAYIDGLQQQYENASNEVDVKEYPSDGLLHSLEELCQKYPQDSYYTWQKGLYDNGEIYFGISDGSDGHYRSLYIRNSENCGNEVRYTSDSHGYTWIAGGNHGRWKDGDEPTDEEIRYTEPETYQLKEYPDGQLTITQEEAKAEAVRLMNALGFSEFQCLEEGRYCEITQEPAEDRTLYYQKKYIFTFFRTLDGVPVDNSSGRKFGEEWQGDVYIKKEWHGEQIEIQVNDDGVIGFQHMAPLEIMETVVSQASMKSFDEIKDIFEQMVVVIHAKDPTDFEEGDVKIKINRVVLRYTRISEQDSFDTGLLVPVWDFMGSKTGYWGLQSGVRKDACILSINAIDGTVIDQDLGY